MKRSFLWTAWILILLLTGCARQAEAPRVQVSLVQTPKFSVEENGVSVLCGQNVRFALTMAPGQKLVSTDYAGEYRIWEQGGRTYLELETVRYPQRINLHIADLIKAVTYDANGGLSGRQTLYYTVSQRQRPNTAKGSDLFTRPGYTLYAWGSAPEGGELVGLGSRVTVLEGEMTLFAQWAKWNEPADFVFTGDRELTLTRFCGSGGRVVIPEFVDGKPVTAIAAHAFQGANLQSVILPKSIRTVEPEAFADSTLEEITLFDNIESIPDEAFAGCEALCTLKINAIERPFGYAYRRESLYADKVDLLITARGTPKVVFYGGCSTWYNLDGPMAQFSLPQPYRVINMGLNGTVSSFVQMQIMLPYLEQGDILFHTPEISSKQQMLQYRDMSEYDVLLWAGLENNYDLFQNVDIRGMNGVFDSFCLYLSMKDRETGYDQTYQDTVGNFYMDFTGSIPFRRTVTGVALLDQVMLDPAALWEADPAPLRQLYERCARQGVRVYLSYACVDLEAVPEAQQNNVAEVDRCFHGFMDMVGNNVVVSKLWDYLYRDKDFCDSVYHLSSDAAARNTAAWLRDLTEQMKKDGLIP